MRKYCISCIYKSMQHVYMHKPNNEKQGTKNDGKNVNNLKYTRNICSSLLLGCRTIAGNLSKVQWKKIRFKGNLS